MQYFIVFILIFGSLITSLFFSLTDIPIYPICVFIMMLSIWSLWSWRYLTEKLFDPYILFLVSAILFNGGQALLEVFSLNEHGLLMGRFPPEILVQTLFLVALGLASFHFGALLSLNSIKIKTLHHEVKNKPDKGSTRHIGWLLLFISILPTILFFKDRMLIVISSGYFSLYQQEITVGINGFLEILSIFLIPASLFLLAGSNDRNEIIPSVIVIICYGVIQLFLGKRGEAIMPLIAYAWLFHYTVRPLSRWILGVCGGIAFFIILPLIKLTRNLSGVERINLDFLLNTFAGIQNPLVLTISEMGDSMRAVAHTVNLMPDIRNFDMGLGYLFAPFTIFPNFFWKIHPTVAHGLPSEWLVWAVNPYIASKGGGIGYSFIAEAYFNFGWFGVPITLIIIGFLYAKLTRWLFEIENVAKMATMATFLSFVLFYPRQTIAMQFRYLVWYSLIPYFAVLVVSKLRSQTQVSWNNSLE